MIMTNNQDEEVNCIDWRGFVMLGCYLKAVIFGNPRQEAPTEEARKPRLMIVSNFNQTAEILFRTNISRIFIYDNVKINI